MDISPEIKVYDTLKKLGINYQKHSHPPVYTVEQARQFWKDIPGTHFKNLFLRDRKGNRHYLIILEANKVLDLKRLNEILNEKLSFASPERLKKHLGLEPGSVSPFGLINNLDNDVFVVIEERIFDTESVNFHPNVNHLTLNIKTSDFIKFLEWSGQKIIKLKEI